MGGSPTGWPAGQRGLAPTAHPSPYRPSVSREDPSPPADDSFDDEGADAPDDETSEDEPNPDSSVRAYASSAVTPFTSGWFDMPQLNIPVPRVDLSVWTVKTPQIDLGALLPRYDWEAWLAPVREIIDELTKSWVKTFAPVPSGLSDAILTAILPANLRSIALRLEELEVLASEGITVYTVPSAPIVRRLLDAPNEAARRDVLGRSLDRIVTDCDEVLDQCVATSTREAVAFTRAAIGAARDGHTAPAQALWANTLDSLLREAFPPDARKRFTDHLEATSERDQASARTYLAMLPIAHGHHRYYPDKGDVIPRAFSRHASAHGVSRRQYSKRSAAQAVLLVTSLIAYLNDL